MAGLLIIGQILAQIVRGDMDNALLDGLQQLGNGGLVIMQRLFTATLHALDGKKHFQKLLIALRLVQGLHLGVVEDGQKGLFDFGHKKLLHVGTLLSVVGCTNILQPASGIYS